MVVEVKVSIFISPSFLSKVPCCIRRLSCDMGVPKCFFLVCGCPQVLFPYWNLNHIVAMVGSSHMSLLANNNNPKSQIPNERSLERPVSRWFVVTLQLTAFAGTGGLVVFDQTREVVQQWNEFGEIGVSKFCEIKRHFNRFDLV